MTRQDVDVERIQISVTNLRNREAHWRRELDAAIAEQSPARVASAENTLGWACLNLAAREGDLARVLK